MTNWQLGETEHEPDDHEHGGQLGSDQEAEVAGWGVAIVGDLGTNSSECRTHLTPDRGELGVHHFGQDGELLLVEGSSESLEQVEPLWFGDGHCGSFPADCRPLMNEGPGGSRRPGRTARPKLRARCESSRRMA